MIRAGLRIARQIGDDTEAARCHVNLVSMLAEARRAEEALQAGEEGVRETLALGLVGRWDEIQSRARAALEDEPEPWSVVSVRIPRCRVALARGDLTAAAAD